MTRKILCVPDLHGRLHSLEAAISKWETGDYDHLVQLGDLEDSHVYPDIHIQECMERLMAFKLAYPEKITLLLGNHAGNYLSFGTRCSGYRASMAPFIEEFYQKYLSLFQVAWSADNYLLTHAGVGKLWLKQTQFAIGDQAKLSSATDLVTFLNQLLTGEYAHLLFECGIDSGGRAAQGGPTWLRWPEAYRHGIPADIHQIVGHTPQKKVRTYTDFRYTGPMTDRSISIIDTLEVDPEGFYELDVTDK